jgi:hypothetical protein
MESSRVAENTLWIDSLEIENLLQSLMDVGKLVSKYIYSAL